MAGYSRGAVAKFGPRLGASSEKRRPAGREMANANEAVNRRGIYYMMVVAG